MHSRVKITEVLVFNNCNEILHVICDMSDRPCCQFIHNSTGIFESRGKRSRTDRLAKEVTSSIWCPLFCSFTSNVSSKQNFNAVIIISFTFFLFYKLYSNSISPRWLWSLQAFQLQILFNVTTVVSICGIAASVIHNALFFFELLNRANSSFFSPYLVYASFYCFYLSSALSSCRAVEGVLNLWLRGGIHEWHCAILNNKTVITTDEVRMRIKPSINRSISGPPRRGWSMTRRSKTWGIKLSHGDDVELGDQRNW